MDNKPLFYANFECGQLYHLYTRVSGKEQIFLQKKNYPYFIQQFIKHVLPYVNVYAYCLIPQHIHILLSFKTKDQSKRSFTTFGRAGT